EESMLIELMVLQQGAQESHQLIMGAASEVTQQVLGIAAFGGYLFDLGQAHGLARLACGQRVLAALERQWWQVALIEAQHLANKDHMVATFIHKGGAALKACGTVVQQRNIVDAAIQFDAGKLVLATGGETAGEGFL